MRRRALLAVDASQNEGISNNMIVYKTNDESIIEPYFNESFGANLVHNIYIYGKGQMVFDGDVTHIGAGAFQEIVNITNIEIPDSVTCIGDYAFYDCESLTSIEIPNSVTSIGYGAFSNCTDLTSTEIPNSVTSIGNYAFAYCSRLASVYIKSTTPPTLDNPVFYNNASGRKIYVPRASVDAYKTAEGWSEYADAIEPYDF